MPVDYCTLSPDRIGSHVISACCQTHDNAYETAATIAEKLQADVALGRCIAAFDGWQMDAAGWIYATFTAVFGTVFWLRARWRRSTTLPQSTSSPAAKRAGLFRAPFLEFPMAPFNDFRGEARPLDDIDLPRLGHRIGVGEDEIHAVIDVEASGGAWDARGRPKMLFEPHRFYKNLGQGAKRDAAVAAGLAYPSWGEKPYPKDSYPVLQKAMAIDETAALKSASWGLGQVLGENHVMVGHDTVQSMVVALLDDSDVHLEQMVAFILAARLDGKLRAHDWSGFARGYNGPQYAKHGYHTRLAAAYARWAGIRDTAWSPETIVLPPAVVEAPFVKEEPPAMVPNAGTSDAPVPPVVVNKDLTPVEATHKANQGALGATLGSGGVGGGIVYLWSLTSYFPAEWAADPQAVIVLTSLSGSLFSAVGAWVAAYRARDKRFVVAEPVQ